MNAAEQKIAAHVSVSPLKHPQRKTLHAIGHAHIDPVWLWPMQEGFAEAKSTFQSALDRMREFPTFTFLASSPLLYQFIQKTHPKMFEEIQQRVKEGRWETVGGMWVEPDCNVPSGESFARQLLYGQRFFNEALGHTATVGFNPDAFGHAGSLPQILKEGGISSYVFMRPHPNETSAPIPYEKPFLWEGTEGTQLPAYRLNSYARWPRRTHQDITQLIERMPSNQPDALFLYGVGNHGGGPTIENIKMIIHLAEEKKDQADIRFSRLSDAFSNIRRAIMKQEITPPVVHGEMQTHAPGCYSADSRIKQKNREAEQRFLAAEKANSLASLLTGHAYPKLELQQVGKVIATNQFHDILAGTAYPDAARTALQQFDEAISMSDRLMWEGLLSIAGNIHIEQQQAMTPLVVFNPHAFKNKTPVELEVPTLKAEDMIVDSQGNRIPFQVIKSHTGAGGRSRIVFVADLPSLGYEVFKIVNRGIEREQKESIPQEASVLENNRFCLTFDKETGYISQLLDKQEEVDLFKGSAAVPVVMDDPTDTWGHGAYRMDKKVGTFTATEPPQMIESGPVRQTIRVKSAYGNSTLIQDFTMYTGIDQIDVRTTVDWHEQHKALKLQFPINLEYREHTFETPYGHMFRPEFGNEVPMQSWVDVSGMYYPSRERYGISFLNDGKYSAHLTNGEQEDTKVGVFNLTVLRSPAAAHHTPEKLNPQLDYEYLDQGTHSFTYSLLPHAKGWEESHTPQAAASFNQRPLGLVTSYNERGILPQKFSGLQVDKDNMLVDVVKQTEDIGSADTIVRLHETTDALTTFSLSIGERTITETVGPGKLLTLRIPNDKNLPYHVTDILEFA